MLTENRALSFPAVVALPELTPSHSTAARPCAHCQLPTWCPSCCCCNKQKTFRAQSVAFQHCVALLPFAYNLLFLVCLPATTQPRTPLSISVLACLALCICTNEAQDEDADRDEERERQWHPALTIIISLRKLEARTCRGVPVVVNQPPAAGKQNTLNGIPESSCCQISRFLSSSFYAPTAKWRGKRCNSCQK